ncbi:MAG TPA: hypothetical protein VLS89_04675 [Candidatus Nanopelagicales bacterium]|nr:hypothetical protein [Candidatus Nanopelagicales bacterium]
MEVRRKPPTVAPGPARGSAQSTDEREESSARIEAELRDLVQSGNVRGARQLLARFGIAEDHPRLGRWARALKPPVVRLGAPGSTPSLEKDAAWLREHAREYFGQWVALREGKFLGSHPDHVALHRDLELRGELEGAVFIRLVNG